MRDRVEKAKVEKRKQIMDSDKGDIQIRHEGVYGRQRIDYRVCVAKKKWGIYLRPEWEARYKQTHYSSFKGRKKMTKYIMK